MQRQHKSSVLYLQKANIVFTNYKNMQTYCLKFEKHTYLSKKTYHDNKY